MILPTKDCYRQAESLITILLRFVIADGGASEDK
jgi:hypothetical protein